jgi:hypothetical protein
MRSITELVDMGLEVATADQGGGGALAVLGAVVLGAGAVGAGRLTLGLRFGDLTKAKVDARRLPKFAKCVRDGKDPETGRRWWEVRPSTPVARQLFTVLVDKHRGNLDAAQADYNDLAAGGDIERVLASVSDPNM